jgi:hypothetical protein
MAASFFPRLLPRGSFRPTAPPAVQSVLVLFGWFTILALGTRARVLRLTTAFVVFCALILAAGCGGGSAGSGGLPGNPGTPPGSYTLTLTASSGNLTPATTVPLVVN